MNYASQDSIRLVVVGLVSIAAIAMGAATIQSTVEFGAAESGLGGQFVPSGNGSGDLDINDTGGNGTLNTGEDPAPGIMANLQRCVDPLAAWYGGILYFGAFFGIVYGIKRRYSLGAAFLGMYAIAPVFFTAYFLLTQCASTLEDRQETNPVVETLGDAASQGVVPTQVSPLVVAAIVGVALVAVAAVLYRASGDQTVTTLDEAEEGDEDQPDVSDLAAAAGKAADRLEEHDADVDNEVYRAWWEMTSLLNVANPESYTPGQFAEAAVDLGMDEADVSQLTTLFEEVRYGRRDAAAREERAIEVFRSIEVQYGEDGNGSGTDGR